MDFKYLTTNVNIDETEWRTKNHIHTLDEDLSMVKYLKMLTSYLNHLAGSVGNQDFDGRPQALKHFVEKPFSFNLRSEFNLN